MLQMFYNQWFTEKNSLIKRALQHSSAEGAGFIPVLSTADKIQSKCPAAARVGINPTPKVVECCKRLIINSLNRMSV